MSVTAIVLAGRRAGVLDPLAEEAGGPLKCLVPIAGRPLIAHVVAALGDSDTIGTIRIVTSDGEMVREALQSECPAVANRLEFVAARDNLADSVIAGASGATYPLLVTTADSVHLTPATIDELVDKASAVEGGAAVAMARREAVLAVHPEGQRKFYSFSDGAFSNCNAYWVGDARALEAAETFRSGGQFVKFPMRIARAFGIVNLLRFHFGIGSTATVFDSFSRRFGFPVRLIELSDGAAAIDVDHARSHRVASEIFAARAKETLAA